MSPTPVITVPDHSLANYLADRIQSDGPITFYEWMREALYNETAGYYMRSDTQIWGREGDYRTSPEASDLFAATFARYFAQLYEELGSGAHFQIVECGSGDGVFAERLLTSLQTFFPDVYQAVDYFIDDVSDSRAVATKRRLSRFGSKVEFAKLKSLAELDPGIIFSNELLDAMPVHRITRRNGKLFELYVSLNPSGQFEYVKGPLSSSNLLDIYVDNGVEIREDQIIELSPDIDDWLSVAAEKLFQGYLITVDYGAETAELYGNPERHAGTIRAYCRHSFSEVLERPGECDITAHVNWTRLITVGARLGLETLRFERQDKFLLDAGILTELERRSASMQSEADRSRLNTGAREMILPNGMASSFQVLVQRRNSI
jgi:SAM-dependent MidA family methyltransferase